MKKLYIGLLFLVTSLAHAQIGFGNPIPDQSAEVDIQSTSKGILIPRVVLTSTTQKLDANINNANALLIYNNGSAQVASGFYYWRANFNAQNENNGTGNWVAMGAEVKSFPKFFYMPSIVIETGTTGTFKRNLHAQYLAQFTGKKFNQNSTTGGAIDVNTPSDTFVVSDGAPATIPNVPLATDIYYYVTDYDKTALRNLGIDANGILTYEVYGSGTDYSFVNIVFVVK